MIDSTPSTPPPIPPARATRFLRLDSRKVSYREYWNLVPSWKVIIPWTAKLLRIPMRFTAGISYFESVRELKVPEASFPAWAREKLQGYLEECQKLGFHSPQFHCYASLAGDTTIAFISLLHPSGATCRLMATESRKVHPPKTTSKVVLLSQLRDGTFHFTTSEKANVDLPPGCVAHRLLKATPSQLVQAHLEAMDALKLRNPAKPVESVEAMDALWDRYETLSQDFLLQRGVYVWMTPEEVEAEKGQLAAAQAMAGASTENVSVLLEMNKLQNQKSGWGSVVMILLVSMALFLGAGSRQWSWNYALILLPVLFVHELGHYLAMKAFNYRNLRMFFIPFFGAAVTGRHYNVPGWKKVIVSLMGPVPGIYLGVIVGCAGLILHQPTLSKVALVALFLNGFNLLPVLPFDGGRVFQTLLFSRHSVLDAGFRAVAAVALMVLGVYSHSKILMYLGIPMLMSIPLGYRMAQIAARLRERGIPPASADDQTVPPETAEAIIRELKASKVKVTSDKVLAQQTLQIFETLNARPPGWGATVGLLFGHVASLGVAVVFAAVLIVGQRGGLLSTLARLHQMPKHPLACGAAQVWVGPQASEKLVPGQQTVVATFTGRTRAEQAFARLNGRLPEGATLRTFGESLLLALPAEADAARKEWVRELQRQTPHVFVDRTNFQTSFSLTCVAPNTATAQRVHRELEGYLMTLPAQGLIPPWCPQDSRSAAEREAQALARQTYLTLQQHQYEDPDSEQQKALRKRIADAQKQGDQAEVEAAVTEMAQLNRQARAHSLERVRLGAYGPVDTNLVALYVAATSEEASTNGTYEQLTRQMAQRMGQLPLLEDHPAPELAGFATEMGMVDRDKLRIQLQFLTFKRLDVGAPALVQWLCSQGCGEFKYEFYPGAGSDDQETE